MTTRAQIINRKIQRAQDKAARRIGTRYDVYRLNANSSGSILAPANKVFSNVFFRFVVDKEGWTIEQTPIYEMVYEGLGSSTLLKIGDVMVDKDEDGEMFTLAEARTLVPNIFARTEVAGSITRPAGQQVNGNASQPLQGRIGHQGLGKPTETTLVLNAGSYDFAATGNPATVPMGIQPYKRLGPMPKFQDSPSMTHRNEVFAYLPLLPGIQLQPGDMLNAQNGDRYQIQTVTPFTTNLQGYLIIAESTFI